MLQARRHPGGRVREHAVRDPGDAARARRRLHRGRRSRRHRATARPARAPLLAAARTSPRSASTSVGPGKPRRRTTPTRRPSTTSSGAAPLVRRARARRPPARARQGARAGRGLAASRGGRARGARARRPPGRRSLTRLVRGGAGRGRAQAGAVRGGARVARTRRPSRSRPSRDDAGLGQVHHLAGTLAAQQGDYEQAIASATRRASRSASASTTAPAMGGAALEPRRRGGVPGRLRRLAGSTTSGPSRCARSSATAGRSPSR